MEGFMLPLILLPGVALLIVSTSTRYGQIHEEIHRLVEKSGLKAENSLHFGLRARRFRDALVGLYLCVSIFALASLIGVTLEVLGNSPRWTIIGLTSLGCAGLLFAAYQLVRESFLSLESIQQHLKLGGAVKPLPGSLTKQLPGNLIEQGESYDQG